MIPNAPRYRLVRGMRMPMGFPPDALDSALAYEPTAGDIFVVSYPKSGTTWLQYIVYLLIRRRPLASDERLTEVFPHLEEVGAPTVERLSGPRLIKTHLDSHLAPWSPAARYLVIARNPFDCAVSFFHHTRGFPVHYDFGTGTFADYFECFIRGEVDFGDYFDHLISWQSAVGRDNVQFLTYESLKSDPFGAIRRIGDFLGAAAAGGVAGDADLDGLIEASSLSSMRQHPQRWSSRRPAWAPPFIRKGEIGDWRTLFTPSQTRALLAKFERRLGITQGANPWPDIIADARAYAETETPTDA